MATEEEKLLLPLHPPPPVVSPPKSTIFDGPMRLNDLLVNEAEGRTLVETVTVTTTTSTESTAPVPIAETATSYFDEEQDVLKTPPVRYRGRSPLTKSQSTDAQLSDRDSASIGSADSNHHQSKLQTLFDKAKAKGKKLVHRKKRKSESSTADVDVVDEVVQVNMDVGTEQMAVRYRMNSTVDAPECPAINAAVVRTVPPAASRPKTGVRKIPFFKFRLAVAALMVVGTIFLPFFVSGFFWGVYLCTVAFLYAFVSKPIEIPQGRLPEEEVQEVVQEMNRQNNLDMNVIYKGWMNELKGRYDPGTYHPNQTRSVLVRLDGKYLRVARPGRNVIKYSYYKDPTATQPEPTMIGQSLYDLTNAEVTLRPKGLAPKRWWVRKYPICIRLASRASEITTVTTEKRNRRVSKTSERSDPPINDESESSAYEDESSDEQTAQSVLTHRKSNSVSENDLSRVGADTDSVIKLPSKTRVRQGKTIYLFNRSHREKERWFHYLREACAQHRTGAFKLASRVTVDAAIDNIARRQSAQSLPEASFIRDGGKAGVNSEYFLYVSNAVQFSRYMAAALGTTPEIECPPPLSGIVNMDLLSSKETKYLANVNSDVVLAANALASRIFYDFCRDEFWVCKVRDKVQSKLSTIALPYFIETLELSKFELGAIAPTITGIHPPVLDEWGLWTDVEISYPGGLRLVLETKVNLMKLKSEGADEGPKRKASRNSGHSAHSHHYSDLDLPISPESSPDEDMDVDETDNGGKGKLLTFVDKLANSSIFQGATDLKPVKKVLKGISSTRLILNVEVTGLEGTMAINFAPPPSDRFWYGFRHPPKLTLKAVPQVGDRAVEFTKVSDWIEKRLAILLEKNLVLPAMDDIIIPVMSGNEMLNMGYNH